MPQKVVYNKGMKVAVFGGSFDPVHKEHVLLVKSAIDYLGLDKVIVMPSYVAPHKAGGACASARDRLEMCRIAFRKMKRVEVSGEEIEAGGTSYTYLTCRRLAEKYPEARRFLLVGADMLEDFFTWKNPEDILSHVTLAACGRYNAAVDDTLRMRFFSRFGTPCAVVPYIGTDVSSTSLRVRLAFGLRPSRELDAKVCSYIKRCGLYADPTIAAALKLEKASRRAHSLRVALMACARARSLGIAEGKALLAAALHDCAKNVSLASPLLEGFEPPDGVPLPVIHQYTGAYLAEHLFGVRDKEILDAIRYHTSGRAGMSDLEALIYLSDLLEEGREFAGIAKLREMFWKDFDACLLCSLALQIDHMRTQGIEVYPLTEEAYLWKRSTSLYQ